MQRVQGQYLVRGSVISIAGAADARDETAALTDDILKVEREIDERVAALYGVPLPEKDRP